MKTSRLFAIVVLIISMYQGSNAETMGTAFTYQGRLIDVNNSANGLYDLQFKLFDANVAGIQKGSTIFKDDVDVIDGYFTTVLDFGSDNFNGDDRWLEIGVRPGDMDDPNVYTVLSPRQQLSPAHMLSMQRHQAAAMPSMQRMVRLSTLFMSITRGMWGLGQQAQRKNWMWLV